MTDTDRARLEAKVAAAERERKSERQAKECRLNLRQLETCGKRFKEMGCGLPSDLNQFVEKKFLKALPKCPNGGSYSVSDDGKGGVTVSCSSGLKGHSLSK